MTTEISPDKTNPTTASPNAASGSWLTRTARKLALWTGLFAAGVGTGRYTYTPPAPYVERIIDGDTLVLTNEKEIRVFGIDAPEAGQPFYEASQARLQDMLKGKTPGSNLEVVSKGSSFGRKVAILKVKGQDIGALMVREGLAFSELKYGKDKYRAEEEQAKKEKKGIWQQPNGGERPWDFRAGKTNKRADLGPQPGHFKPFPVGWRLG